MRFPRWHAIILVLVAVVLVALIAILTKALRMNPIPDFVQKGRAGRDFTLPLIVTSATPSKEGELLALSALRGKPLIINFWASWCVSCREEGAALQEFYAAEKGRIQLVGIAIQDTPQAAAAFAAAVGMTFPLLLDEKGSVAIDYGVTGVPETFILDAKGIIQDRFVGPVTREDLDGALH